MRRQKKGIHFVRLTVCMPKKIDWTVRNLAGKRKQSISRVTADLIKDSLKRQGFLKDGE